MWAKTRSNVPRNMGPHALNFVPAGISRSHTSLKLVVLRAQDLRGHEEAAGELVCLVLDAVAAAVVAYPFLELVEVGKLDVPQVVLV